MMYISQSVAVPCIYILQLRSWEVDCFVHLLFLPFAYVYWISHRVLEVVGGSFIGTFFQFIGKFKKEAVFSSKRHQIFAFSIAPLVHVYESSNHDCSTISRTRRLYSRLFSLYRRLASELAGDAGLGSHSRDWIDVKIAEMS